MNRDRRRRSPARPGGTESRALRRPAFAELAGAVRVTLVLGAGVSRARGVPLWPELVQRLWRRIFGDEADYRGSLADHLARARRLLVSQGWDDDLVGRLDLPIHPFELQFALEIVRRALDDDALRTRVVRRLARSRKAGDPPADRFDTAQQAFTELLREALYSDCPAGGTREADTLSVIGDVLRRDAGRRIVRVISFNADDWIEREVNGSRSRVRACAVTRAVDRPDPSAIPIYHVHGYLPRRSRAGRGAGERAEARETLVFTDAQYWASVASPLSFANRVFVNALHDSQCVFIGLSMADVDVIRWLGIHANETEQELIGGVRDASRARDAGGLPRAGMGVHFWIRRDAEDPAGLLGRFLRERGVVSLAVDSWSPDELERALGPLAPVR